MGSSEELTEIEKEFQRAAGEVQSDLNRDPHGAGRSVVRPHRPERSRGAR